MSNSSLTSGPICRCLSTRSQGAATSGHPMAVCSFRAENDAGLLASLADEVQEVTMERDQVNVFVWLVCKAHQLGGHADVVAGVAVWSCNGAGMFSHPSGS
jgi:hypothetical protein